MDNRCWSSFVGSVRLALCVILRPTIIIIGHPGAICGFNYVQLVERSNAAKNNAKCGGGAGGLNGIWGRGSCIVAATEINDARWDY